MIILLQVRWSSHLTAPQHVENPLEWWCHVNTVCAHMGHHHVSEKTGIYRLPILDYFLPQSNVKAVYNLKTKSLGVIIMTRAMFVPISAFLLFFCVRICKGEDTICNPVVMSVLLSVCNKPRPQRHELLLAQAEWMVSELSCGEQHVLYDIFGLFLLLFANFATIKKLSPDIQVCTSSSY